jgi:hypothetical protein
LRPELKRPEPTTVSELANKNENLRKVKDSLVAFVTVTINIICGNQCCGSGRFILDPGSEFFPSRIPDPNFFPSRIRIKEFKYFNPKNLFLSSRKYDPGCSSRIRILIPDTGVKKAPDPGSGSATLLVTTDPNLDDILARGRKILKGYRSV